MKKLSFTDYIAIFIFSINLIPQLKDIVTNVTLISLMFLWIIITLFKILKYKGIVVKWILWLFFWVIFGSVISLLNGNIDVLQNYIYELLSCVFPFIVFCIRYEYIFKNRDKFLNIITAIMVVSNIINITTNQYMSKSIFLRTDESYKIVYITVIFALIVFYKINSKSINNKRRLIVDWSVFIISVVNIFTSGYTIANIVLIIGIVSLVVGNNINFSLKIIIILFVCVTTYILSYIYIDNIFQVLLNNIENPIYYERIYDVFIYLKGNKEYSTLTARLDMYYKSIYAFMQHPLIGSIWSLNPSENVYTVVGYHSTTLDNFGLFGLVGGSFVIYIMFYPFRWLFNRIDKDKVLIVVISFAFLFIITINNQIPGIGVISYFYLPLLTISNEKLSKKLLN